MERVMSWKNVAMGQLGFFRGDTALSETLSYVTEREDLMGLPTPSHSAIILSKSQVFESVLKTRIRPLMIYKKDFENGDFIVFDPDVPREIRIKALSRMTFKYNGAVYGWLQIPGFLPALAYRRLTGRQGFNPLPVGTVCSELSLMLCRYYYEELLNARMFPQARKLFWAKLLHKNTTDPALLLACCLRDGLPENLAGLT